MQSESQLNDLQKLIIEKLDDVFACEDIQLLERKIQYGLGVRGAYANKQVVQLDLKTRFRDYTLEFYLNYDQLEYYVLDKKGNVLKECNLEDASSYLEMTSIFIDYLKTDLSTL